LRQFHLQPPFGRSGTPGEDIEDQLGPIDYLDSDRGFEVALLRGAQFVVDDKNIGLRCRGEFRQFLNLAASEQSSGFECGANLKYVAGNLRARTGRKFTQLAKRLRRGGGWRSAATFKSRKNRPFRMLLEGNRRLLFLCGFIPQNAVRLPTPVAVQPSGSSGER
jgi:hypothetical protein